MHRHKGDVILLMVLRKAANKHISDILWLSNHVQIWACTKPFNLLVCGGDPSGSTFPHVHEHGQPCYTVLNFYTSSCFLLSPLLLWNSHHPPSSSVSSLSAPLAAILDDQSVCGRGERLALALARENINSVIEGPARARVEVDIYELQKDSQYDTTDTSEWIRCTSRTTTEADLHNPSENDNIHQKPLESTRA